MSEERPDRESGRSWLAGVIVVVAVAVAYVGFARVSVGWTLLASSLIVVGLVAFLWRAGARKQGRTGGRR